MKPISRRLIVVAAAALACAGAWLALRGGGLRPAEPQRGGPALTTAPQRDDRPPRRQVAEPAAAPAAPADEAFVGAGECRTCHEDFYKKWSTSWHGLAMRPYTPEFAHDHLAPMPAATTIRGHSYEARIGSQRDAVLENGPDGKKAYPIAQVMGGKDVFFFLTPLAGGRLQVLPLAFDARRKHWYDTSGSMVRHFVGRHDEALDWTDRLFTFNASCEGCHVSQISKNYSLETDTYKTSWREPGINCESCHGPGRKHVDMMLEHKAKGLAAMKKGCSGQSLGIIVVGELTPAQRNSLCAQCHAKGAPLAGAMPPGGLLFDYFRLTTLEDPDFYADGRDLGENFTQTSWLMSPCAAGDRLQCTDCHTSSGRLNYAPADADRACTPCHAKLVADPVAHSHHPLKPGVQGVRCIECHMPETEFSLMRRHDHSMLPPVPAATLKFQSPNACNLCHKDHDAVWSDEWVRKWYPRDYQAPLVHRAELIDAARKGDWTRLDEMVRCVQGEVDGQKPAAGPQTRGTGPGLVASAQAARGTPGQVASATSSAAQPARGAKAAPVGDPLAPLAGYGRNEVFVASLLRLMDRAADPRKWPAYRRAIDDASPLVRAAAADGLAACPEPGTVEALVRAAADKVRLVRIEAAVALARRGSVDLDPASRAVVAKAEAEYDASLRSRPDDPLSHYNLANRYQDAGNLPAALAEYQVALRLDPSIVPALVNLSMVHAKLGQLDEAERALRRALHYQPASAEANFNLGLLLAEVSKTAEAEACLRAALAAEPNFAQAAFDLAVLVSPRDLEEAIRLCRKAVEVDPEQARYVMTLAGFLHQAGDDRGASGVLRQLLQRHPDNKDAAEALKELSSAAKDGGK
jgi:tetratricopeptide (TPR) repeat protein